MPIEVVELLTVAALYVQPKGCYVGLPRDVNAESVAATDASRRDREVDALMQQIPEAWRLSWCESPLCGCRGCVNGAGRLQYWAGHLAITKDEWRAWADRNRKASA